MVLIEDIARAVLEHDAFKARSLTQDLERGGVNLSSYPAPLTTDMRVVRMTAALVTLFSFRRGVQPPAWTQNVGKFPEPFFVSANAMKSPKMRERLSREAPTALREYGVYGSADFLAQV